MSSVPEPTVEVSLPSVEGQAARSRRRLRIDPALSAIALLLVALALYAPAQVPASLVFATSALWSIAPWIVVSVGLAAYAKASGADRVVAAVFSGHPVRTVVLASLFGALSPFCSCGVVPVVAGLLGAGVPLAPVMAFWVSSPLMDPTMFVMTSANLGLEFALAKTLAAVAIGLGAGAITHLVTARGLFVGALRSEAVPAPAAAPTAAQPAGSGCAKTAKCSSSRPSASPPPRWRIWASAQARAQFAASAGQNLWMLGRWMTLAFLLESLMSAWVPASTVTSLLGDGVAAIPAAVVIGVPAYFNGYAALPLVRGLVDLGMTPAVGMAFLVAGAMTSIPAAAAVWALVRPRVFGLYLAFAIGGALAAGYAYALWLALAGA